MTTTTLNASSRVQKWDSQYFAEYIRNSGLMPYMGKGTNSIFQVKYELTGGGKTINIPLVTRLTGAGVTGSTALVGAEEELDNYSMSVSIDWLRNGVEIKKPEEHWTEMDLRAAARDMLQAWSMSKLRDDLIAAMYSIQGVAYGSATAAQRDAWLDDNIDRVLFGATKSNVSTSAPAGGATYDHSASLLNIDATTDKLTPAAISLMKRIAKTADPHIRPYKTNDGSGREYFVAFAPSLSFRDLKENTTMTQANREARERNVDSNPIFQDGDLIYDGVIIKEVEDIPAFPGLGAGGTVQVAPGFLCGAQSVGVAIAQRTRSVEDEPQDYGRILGIGVEEIRGVQKLRFGTGANDTDATKDFGIVTHWSAAAADA